MSGYPQSPGYGVDYHYPDYSPSPTPSPHRRYAHYPTHGAVPPRPATQGHFRTTSAATADYYRSTPPTQPQPPLNPRFNSQGHYATVNVSQSPPRKGSLSGHAKPRHERRGSFFYWWASDSHGESDEDEYIEIDGITYVIPARPKTKRRSSHYVINNAGGGYGTDHRYYGQDGRAQTREPLDAFHMTTPLYREPAEQSDPTPDRRPAAKGRPRRSSVSNHRPQTCRPASSYRKTAPPPATEEAIESDAERAMRERKAEEAKRKFEAMREAKARELRIPSGYSLKNWNPDEEPMLLLGSVFDSNSLGKWIYDWTVYYHGSRTPIAEIAGELWLLLIMLTGKMKRAAETVREVRSEANQLVLEGFIEGGERLIDRLSRLLKNCEEPMLSRSKHKTTSLGSGAGVEFVKCLFGKDRQLDSTEHLMQNIRVWNFRFEANCEEILKNPNM